MIYGAYLSTMGALVQSHRHATISNNLANSNTHGFKPDWSIFNEVPIEDSFHPDRQFLWDQILVNTGGGVWNDYTITNLKAGPMNETGNAYDIALHDEPGSSTHSFFMVRPDNAEAGEVYYSRDGHFIPDQENILRNDNGDMLLGIDGQPISVLAPVDAFVSIREDGSVLASNQDGTVILGQIAVQRTTDYRNMRKVGDSRFVADGATMENWQNGVRSGYLEESSTNAIDEMTNMIEASRIYEANMRFLTIQDSTLGQTISRVGSPSGGA